MRQIIIYLKENIYYIYNIMPRGKNKLRIVGTYDRVSKCSICGKVFAGNIRMVSKLSQLHIKFEHKKNIPSHRDTKKIFSVDISKTNMWKKASDDNII
jgi:hypothetical protein